MAIFRHEYDFDGNHRLVVDGVKGEWISYDQPAENGKYRAHTDYFGMEIYEVRSIFNEQETQLIEFGICKVCEKPLPKEGEEATACAHVMERIAIINRTFQNMKGE